MSRNEAARPRRCRVLSGGFILALILAGLTTGLLSVAAAALLEQASRLDATEPRDGCLGFQVGSAHAADTHIRLENVGPERIHVGLDYFDDTGLDPPSI